MRADLDADFLSPLARLVLAEKLVVQFAVKVHVEA